MKIIVGAAIAVLTLAVLWGLMQVLAGESGEVVVLTTVDDAGAAQETRLWVVDHDGSAWLRSGTGVSGWYERVVKQPNIEVERNAATASYVAKPEPLQRDEINRLLSEKYGWADTYIGWWISRDDAIPIRLVPR